MNFDIFSMKQRAKALLKEINPAPIIPTIFFNSITLVNLILFYLLIDYSFGWSVLFIIYFIFQISCKWYSLKITREEPTAISDIISSLKIKPLSSIILAIIKSICCFIGCCILGFGLLFPVYWFRMSEYILKDNDINPFKAMRLSMKMLKGHYMELIKLDLSNIGWYALNVFSLGISGIYTKIYLGIVYAEFYDYLKSQNDIYNT